MNKAIKWGGIAVGVCLVLIVGAVVLVPMFVDVQKYKPKIEALVTEQTGRSFSMGDDIKLSVFPWVGVSLSDLILGNAEGFDGKEMISVKGFEIRLKVMPLLSRSLARSPDEFWSILRVTLRMLLPLAAPGTLFLALGALVDAPALGSGLTTVDPRPGALPRRAGNIHAARQDANKPENVARATG